MCDKLSRKFIVWPDHDAQEQISRVIYESSGLPNCIGFIDGTHIGLSFLPNGDKDYINRKGYPSIQLQLVVDDKMMIRDTYVGWPDCVHDDRVYRNYPIFNCLEHDSGVHLAPDKYLICKIRFLHSVIHNYLKWIPTCICNIVLRSIKFLEQNNKLFMINFNYHEMYKLVSIHIFFFLSIDFDTCLR